MSTWSNAVITNKGIALLSKMIAGNTLQITKAITGAGTVTVSTLPAQTGVTNQKQIMSFWTISYPAAGTCAVPAYITNEGLTEGYTAKQIGIFAMDPDEGEILFFIAQDLGGTAVPAISDMPGFSAEWTFSFKYGRADSVSVTVDPSNTVSQAQLEGYLPLSGGAMTGPISYRGTNVVKSMIRFLNSAQTDGLGISIGGGGVTIVGSGEAPGQYENAVGGADELLILCADGPIEFYAGANNGAGSAKKMTMNADGSLTNTAGFIGVASLAAKLKTARTMRVNLESTSAASFDGSSNIQPGVNGVLPVANGGTGNSSVDTTPVSGSTKMVTSGGVFAALAAKEAKVTGAATTITGSNLTANRAVVSNGSGKVGVSATTSTELGYLSGATSNIQSQLNNRLVKNAGNTVTGDLVFNNTGAARAVGKNRTISGVAYYTEYGIGQVAGKGALNLILHRSGSHVGTLAMNPDAVYYKSANGTTWQALTGPKVIDATTEE